MKRTGRSDAKGALLEDELFTLVRTDPSQLPVGDTKLIPASFDARLRHYQLEAKAATAVLGKADAKGMRDYTVRYPDSRRELTITFESRFPHAIHAFREKIAGRVTLDAKRTHVVKSAYWGQHSERDNPLRATLGLEQGDLGRADGKPR